MALVVWILLLTLGAHAQRGLSLVHKVTLGPAFRCVTRSSEVRSEGYSSRSVCRSVRPSVCPDEISDYRLRGGL